MHNYLGTVVRLRWFGQVERTGEDSAAKRVLATTEVQKDLRPRYW